MGEQSRSIVSVLKDPALTRFYVTMIPEELPVTEGLELARDIQGEMEQIPELIFNRYLESPLTVEQLRRFEGHEFADYLAVLLERQAGTRRQAEGRGMPLRLLPWIFTNNVPEKIRLLAAALEPS
ncbi:MAG: ArsA family ATPase [Calothrix sp. SM1_5_4]|nr:ArsA family ATPase [Calothrix sp. SM1_5_4]